MKALLVAGNFAQARIAMENIDEPVSFVRDGEMDDHLKGIEPHTVIYFYGTYEDREDFGEVMEAVKNNRLDQRNVIIRDGLWRGRI